MSVVSEVMKMTDTDDLRNIIDVAQNRMNALLSAQLRSGAKVQMLPKHQGAKPYDTIGIVERVNAKTISVRFGQYGGYRVSKSMLQIVK
jgi:hypothetical protein